MNIEVTYNNNAQVVKIQENTQTMSQSLLTTSLNIKNIMCYFSKGPINSFRAWLHYGSFDSRLYASHIISVVHIKRPFFIEQTIG